MIHAEVVIQRTVSPDGKTVVKTRGIVFTSFKPHSSSSASFDNTSFHDNESNSSANEKSNSQDYAASRHISVQSSMRRSYSYSSTSRSRSYSDRQSH